MTFSISVRDRALFSEPQGRVGSSARGQHSAVAGILHKNWFKSQWLFFPPNSPLTCLKK